MCCSDYNACVFAAIWSLVQTIFHISVCIWGKYLYECYYELDDSTFKYFWYLTYFYTNSCVNATLEHLFASSKFIIVGVESEDVPLPNVIENNYTFDAYKHESNIILTNPRSHHLEFPTGSAVAERTYNIVQTFIIIDALWIIAAVALLVGTCYRIRDSLATVFFFPWAVILLFILVFDGVAAGWYGIDISYTYGITNWFIFIGGRNQTGLDEIDAKIPKTASTQPSVMMMMFFSRFFVVWFVNLFLFFRVVQAAVNAVEDFEPDESLESKNFNQGNAANVNITINKRPRKFQVRSINPHTASIRIRRWHLYYGTDEEDEEEEEKEVKRCPRRNSKQRDQKREKRGKSSCNNESGQNLAVIGGYEGDRSTSPSPLPSSGPQTQNTHSKVFSFSYESNNTYLSNDQYETSSSSKHLDYSDIHKDQQTRLSCIEELKQQYSRPYFQNLRNPTMSKDRYADTTPTVKVSEYILK